MHVEPTMEKGWKPHVEMSPTCPRCGSSNTKFCYYNNYSLTQPRYFCKACRRYWTKGGSLRNVPVGGGCRKTRRSGRPHIIAPRPAGGGRISDIINTSLSPSPSIAKRGDHGSSIDLALVYANFLNQKPRVNVNDQNSSPPDHHNHNQHHHLPLEIPGNLTFGGGNYGLMSFQFPYPLMSHVNHGAFLDATHSAYGHHQSSDGHFSNAFDYLSGLDSIHRDKQADYHQFMTNSSSVENVTNNPMSYNLPPLPGHDHHEELNILWSDSSNNNLVFPSSNTDSTLGNASQHDHDQLSSRIEEQRMLPQHDAAEARVQEQKRLGEINGIGSQINLPIELCNFLGLE